MTKREKDYHRKPGYNCPVERNPHKDMLAVITMDGDTEIARWMHRGNLVFTVTTYSDGTMKYRSEIY